MILKAFSIYDKKTSVFGAPFYAPTAGSAERTIQDETKRPESMLSRHPEDFDLYEVGVFDDSTGSFQPDGAAMDKARHLLNVKQLTERTV